VGQVLAIPGGSVQARAGGGQKGVYTVRKGDTVDGIARRFGVSSRQISELNGLQNRHRIRVGQRLYVPGPGGR
jgi:LysM repeat protein